MTSKNCKFATLYTKGASFSLQLKAAFLPCFLALAAIYFIQPLQSAMAQSEIDEEHKARSLSVLNYVTGWSLDSGGYHPAVYMLLENTSGRDLSGVTIKMQGKFTDLHTLEPSTGRSEIRRSLKPHQQFPVSLIAPRDFELPRDTNAWPSMECKAMMRVGTVGDEGTEYLLVTKIDSAVTTQDEAFEKLNELTSYNRSNPPAGRREGHGRSEPKAEEFSHTKPLIAKADRIKTAAPSVVPQVKLAKSNDLFAQKSLPGLGDDFYSFEKAFGLPVAIDAKKKDFTWAKYKHSASGIELIVASKERSGKADLITFVLPRSSVKNDAALVEQCKLFSGTQHSVKLGSPTKSVRYLPSGRLELLTASGPGLKILSMALPESPERAPSFLVMISRLSQEPDEVLRSHQGSTDILKNLPMGEAAGEKN